MEHISETLKRIENIRILASMSSALDEVAKDADGFEMVMPNGTLRFDKADNNDEVLDLLGVKNDSHKELHDLTVKLLAKGTADYVLGHADSKVGAKIHDINVGDLVMLEVTSDMPADLAEVVSVRPATVVEVNPNGFLITVRVKDNSGQDFYSVLSSSLDILSHWKLQK